MDRLTLRALLVALALVAAGVGWVVEHGGGVAAVLLGVGVVCGVGAVMSRR